MVNLEDRAAVEEVLDVERLLTIARNQAGLSDFGDEGFLIPFAKLLECSCAQVSFSPHGLRGFEGDTVRALVNLLRMQKDFMTYPEIEDEDVSDPIVIVGLVRTGTTKLLRLLSVDPGSHFIPLWQMLYLGRIPGLAPGAPDPRRDIAANSGGYSEEMQAINSAHSTSLDEPDEDIILFEHSFEHMYHFLRTPASDYLEWVQTRSPRAAYLGYRRMLQYLQWQNGGRQRKPWILKTTSHVAELPLLFELFPRATVVNCHRDPAECVPSYSRLQEYTWRLRTPGVEPKFIGKWMMDLWGDIIRRGVKSRELIASTHSVLDISYRTITQDGLSVVRQIYNAVGRKLTTEAEEKMRRWEADNVQHKFGKHEYTAEYFGITSDLIANEFREYNDAYGKYF